jgi:hypothetical protein
MLGADMEGWKRNSFKLENSWACDSCIGAELFYEDLASPLKVINIYGPYMEKEKIPFWEDLMSKSFWTHGKFVAVGDLKFVNDIVEVWGPRARLDPLADFFKNLLLTRNLVDIEPIKLCPTWRNMRSGED